jgi:UDP-N-acetylmuramoylalanine--D-glutamate ligase
LTPATAFAGRHVALFGLGGSGLATAKALAAGGAQVSCWDDGEPGREKAREAGLNVVDLTAADWSRFSSFILSPGVPLTHPAPHWSVERAHAAGVEIIGDIEVFFRERAKLAPASPVVAITGTNGKSTTTALIAHILRAAGRDVQMGGNIGTNILDLAPPSADRTHVIEMSSFQIDLTPSLAPTVGIQINLTPDHLDRHGTMESYAAIKERMVQRADIAVCGVDDSWSRAMADRRAATGKRLTRFSTGRLISGIAARGGAVSRIEGGEEFDIASLAGVGSLRGAHNAQNAAAAAAAALALGVPEATIRQAILTYASLPHRMEQLGSVGRTVFINDSKATNADSTRGALAGGEGIFWILGGKAKDGGIEDLRPLFGAVAKAYLIGDAADVFAATLEGTVPHARCGTLDVAVAQAAADATASAFAHPIVLLSPACASYDQYKSFEHRGQHFRDLVRALPGFTPINGGA